MARRGIGFKARISAILAAWLVGLLSSAALAQGDAKQDPLAGLTNWALGAPYKVSQPPSDTYPDPQGKKLTDGVYAKVISYRDPAWVGHLRQDFRIITVDLGQVRPIQAVRANFLHERSVGVYFPAEVRVKVSQDGLQWQDVGTIKVSPEESAQPGPVTKSFTLAGLDVRARYVQLTILVDVWVFIDEIEVLGRE